jgi:VIT1/CCC1 family predicted Fe2+/Mn2+ transporter
MRELNFEEIAMVSGGDGNDAPSVAPRGCAAVNAIGTASGYLGAASVAVGVAAFVPGPHSLAAGAAALAGGVMSLGLFAASQAVGHATGCNA